MANQQGWAGDDPRDTVFEDATEHQCPERARFRGTRADGDNEPELLFGPAIQRIVHHGGAWFATNGEYSTEIRYCPWCGEMLGGSNEAGRDP